LAQRLIGDDPVLEEKIVNHNRYISLIAWRDFERSLSNFRTRYLNAREQRLDPQSVNFWKEPQQQLYPHTVEDFTNILIQKMEKWYGPKLYPNLSDLNNAIIQMQQDVTYKMGYIDSQSIYSFIGLL
jgi:hypothetical protein